jgi:hypothetical protein
MKAKIVVTHPATGKEWNSQAVDVTDAELKAIHGLATAASNGNQSLSFECGNKQYYIPADFLRQCVVTVVTEVQDDGNI